MPLIYTQPSDIAKLIPHKLAAELLSVVQTSFDQLARIPSSIASQSIQAGKWSHKQVIGHLIDSAANNHQRFVRLQIEPELNLPGYRQEDWVRVQCYEVLPWTQTLETWKVLNEHLSHVIHHVKTEHLTHVWHSEEGDLTLGFLIEDYIAHMKHHLKQLPAYGEPR